MREAPTGSPCATGAGRQRAPFPGLGTGDKGNVDEASPQEAEGLQWPQVTTCWGNI